LLDTVEDQLQLGIAVLWPPAQVADVHLASVHTCRRIALLMLFVAPLEIDGTLLAFDAHDDAAQ